jgi:hypothetical protein
MSVFVERLFLRMLLVWGLLGIASGAAAMVPAWGKADPTAGEKFIAAVGSQFFIWGAIDALLAGLGLRGVGGRERKPLPVDEESLRREKARRTLRFNAKLDWVWIGGGVLLILLAVPFPGGAASLIGHGVGVIAQGGFLLLFDHLFARRLGAVIDAAA